MSVETIIEHVTKTELVTENIGPRGVEGPPGPPGADSGKELREELDRLDDLSLLFNNGLI